MVNNRKSVIAIFTFVLVILLSGCGDTSNESSAKLDSQSQNKNSLQDTDDDSYNKDSSGSVSTAEDSNTVNHSNKTDENSPTNHTEAALKEKYLKKLNDAKKESEELKATDSSTYALKKVENDRWDIWDELLNEIYGVLKEQLPSKEMDRLREEQRNWIKYRDDSALEASQKYKGGTLEHLEYVAVLANLTEKRCYELVEGYMK